MIETHLATLKTELAHSRRLRMHENARPAIFEWIEVWYQRARIHGSLGYVRPEAFEAAARAGWDQSGCPRVSRESRMASGWQFTIRSIGTSGGESLS
jgi:putative transposase